MNSAADATACRAEKKLLPFLIVSILTVLSQYAIMQTIAQSTSAECRTQRFFLITMRTSRPRLLPEGNIIQFSKPEALVAELALAFGAIVVEELHGLWEEVGSQRRLKVRHLSPGP
jgi:hypothetical protein